jgi:glycosyltransferase involved in cell wall biosynthesis
MRDFDLFVSTSRWEGLPLVLLEAMEQGIPIVASDVIGNRDVLQGWGMLFNANDPKAAGEAQIQLALDAPLRARLAKLGREVRRSRFALSRMLREMDQAYCEILGASIFPNGQISGPSVATQADASTRWSAGVSFPG